MKMTPNMKTTKNEDDLNKQSQKWIWPQNEEDSKNEDDSKNKDDL